MIDNCAWLSSAKAYEADKDSAAKNFVKLVNAFQFRIQPFFLKFHFSLMRSEYKRLSNKYSSLF